MTFREALLHGEKRLEAAGIAEARTECEHMLMHMLGVTRSQLQSRLAEELREEKRYLALIIGREKRIPLAYLLGDVFFHSLKLKVGPGCLIPRPETELLVEKVISALSGKPPADAALIADIGCGSGAIALAVLKAVKNARAVLTDISEAALEAALENARTLDLEKRAEFILSDLFSNLPQGRKFDWIVSNPPYLTDEDMQNLQPELAFEPRMALAGGPDGCDFYRRIIRDAGKFLKPGGMLGLEIGMGQAGAAAAELKKAGFKEICIFKDHQEIERTLTASYG